MQALIASCMRSLTSSRFACSSKVVQWSGKQSGASCLPFVVDRLSERPTSTCVLQQQRTWAAAVSEVSAANGKMEVKFEHTGVLHILINRPKALNAMDAGTFSTDRIAKRIRGTARRAPLSRVKLTVAPLLQRWWRPCTRRCIGWRRTTAPSSSTRRRLAPSAQVTTRGEHVPIFLLGNTVARDSSWSTRFLLASCRFVKDSRAPTGGDVKAVREYVLQQPYERDPPLDHQVPRVGHPGRHFP